MTKVGLAALVPGIKANKDFQGEVVLESLVLLDHSSDGTFTGLMTVGIAKC